MADMGMVLMMVVPGLVVLVGDMLLMLRMVGLVPVLPAWVVMMVVGLPSADVTSFRMVPAGRGPFVWGGGAKWDRTRRESQRLENFSHKKFGFFFLTF